ncbi:MAG: YggT family protein [Campylobacter sp.]
MSIFNLLVIALHFLIQIYIFIIIIACLISFLPLNLAHPLARKIVRFFYILSEPLFDLVRKNIPTSFGGIDFSPLVIIIALQFLDFMILNLARSIY